MQLALLFREVDAIQGNWPIQFDCFELECPKRIFEWAKNYGFRCLGSVGQKYIKFVRKTDVQLPEALVCDKRFQHQLDGYRKVANGSLIVFPSFPLGVEILANANPEIGCRAGREISLNLALE